MTNHRVDTDASATTAHTGGEFSATEVWAAPRLATVMSDEPWQETTASGTLVRRQLVFIPSADPWVSIDNARVAMTAGAPRVLRLRPGALGHRFPLVDWVLEPLPAVCEREGYALALDYGPRGAVPLGELAGFACSAPEVPLLLLGDRLGDLPGIWRLLDRCPNVLLQVTSRATPADVADGMATFGAHRFVWGSRGLNGSTEDELTEPLGNEERAALLGGNARDLDALDWRERWL